MGDAVKCWSDDECWEVSGSVQLSAPGSDIGLAVAEQPHLILSQLNNELSRERFRLACLGAATPIQNLYVECVGAAKSLAV